MMCNSKLTVLSILTTIEYRCNNYNFQKLGISIFSPKIREAIQNDKASWTLKATPHSQFNRLPRHSGDVEMWLMDQRFISTSKNKERHQIMQDARNRSFDLH